MKNSIRLLMLIAVCLLSSCAKVQTCTCYNIDGSQAFTKTNKSYTQSSANSFKDYCHLLDVDYMTYGGHCDLK